LKNIVNFISGKDLGGSKQSFILYSEVFEKLGYNTTSLIKKGAKIKPLLEELSLRVVEVEYKRINISYFIDLAVAKLKNTFSSLDVDIIFVHKPIDVKLIRKALGENVKIIAIVHSYSHKYLEYANEIIAVSSSLKNFLLEKSIKNKIHIVPNMITLNSNYKYKDIPSIPLIGSMGVFRRTKGFHILIYALFILKKRNIPFKAVIAGKGKLYFYYKFLIFKYQLQDVLILKDWISNNERDSFLESLDIYMLPSKQETFGMVIAEAMAKSKRVIATKCGGAEEIITDKENGFLVENKNPTLIADILQNVITNKINSNHIPKNAYDYVAKNYDKNVIMKTLDNIIKEN
jgi:glycosyltransferase involved in cell wall biosynthesis